MDTRPPRLQAPVPFNLHAAVTSRPYKPSRLAPSPPAPTLGGSVLSDSLSSPTTSSFYASATSRSSSRTSNMPSPASAAGRTYKSQSSARRTSASDGRASSRRPTHATSSSPTSISNVTLNAHRATRRPSAPKATRDLTLGDAVNPFESGVYAPGGMNKDGEWEEWTEEEDYGLAIEAMRAKKEWNYRRRLAEGESSEPELLEDDEQEQSQDEPPNDVWLSDLDLDPAELHAAALARPRLPSLASDPGSATVTEGSSSQTAANRDRMDVDLDAPSTTEPSLESLQFFEHALLAQNCPKCGTQQLWSSSTTGLGCAACDWLITAEMVQPLARAFADHHGGEYTTHRPLAHFTPFTGTVIMCTACDEELGA